jgi:ABC-type Fe3+-hydroxamate transport system substrate-binding protein
MPVFTDQLQRQINLEEFPQRIVSLVPSITELLFDLKIDDEVLGITKFCVRPESWFKTKTKVGGTKNVKVDVVASLKPQLIIANKEENVKEQIEALENIAPVFITDVNNLNAALQMIEVIGEIANRVSNAKSIIQKIKNEFASLPSPLCGEGLGMRACYLIWRNPYMTVGGDTFINDMLERCGFENVFKTNNRYPEISISQLFAVNCQVVMLSSEPYPFKQKHIYELQPFLPSTKIILVDGEMFSWYGSRLQFAAAYFLKLVNELNTTDEKL